MIINAAQATAVLLEEAERARSEAGDPRWRERLEKLDALCANVARTHIAALGTAMLAKAVNIDVDVYALKRTKGGPRAYVARALAKDVLAAGAPELELDIGVYGREPLNNQPYFREERISRQMPVKANARPALAYLVDLLDLLDRVEDPAKAREVLRTYIVVRREHFRRPGLAPEGDALTLAELTVRLEQFTSAASEGGKRLQAAVAGLLDAAYGAERVRATRVNDPDRTLPGDIGILAAPGESGWTHVFEVRDKAVSEPDLHHFLHKASPVGVKRIGMLALARQQPELDLDAIGAAASARGMQLIVRRSWRDLVQEVAFWSSTELSQFGRSAITRIDARLIEFDVRSQTLAEWRAMGSDADDSPGAAS